MAIIMSQKLGNPANLTDANYDQALFSGYALFWTGITVGISNLVCG